MTRQCQAISGGLWRQAGVSLVELMIALVIGLIIILGAGQLFLSGFMNFRQVELLGEKQSALVYASEVLLRDIRRAKAYSSSEGSVEWDEDTQRLKLVVADRDDVSDSLCDANEPFLRKEYWSEDGALFVDVLQCLDEPHPTDGTDVSFTPEPVATGFADTNGFQADQVEVTDSDGDVVSGVVWELIFNLRASAADASQVDDYTFLAVNRTLAMIIE